MCVCVSFPGFSASKVDISTRENHLLLDGGAYKVYVPFIFSGELKLPVGCLLVLCVVQNVSCPDFCVHTLLQVPNGSSGNTIY